MFRKKTTSVELTQAECGRWREPSRTPRAGSRIQILHAGHVCDQIFHFNDSLYWAFSTLCPRFYLSTIRKERYSAIVQWRYVEDSESMTHLDELGG